MRVTIKRMAERMHIGRIVAVSALMLTSLVASGAQAKVISKYSRWGFGKPYGYRDHIVSTNRWEVNGLGTYAGPGYMEALVFRRAATLAKAYGYSYFYVTAAGQVCSGSPFLFSPVASGPDACSNILSQSSFVIAIGTSSLTEQLPCQGRDKQACRSYAVDEVVIRTNSYFGLTDQQFIEDVERHRSQRK